MIALYLDRIGHSAGGFRIRQREYSYAADDGGWDGDKCLANATKHARRADEVAVVGPMHSYCAMIEVPVMNRTPTGPLVAVSNAATSPGLTKIWDPGEPGAYYPSGRRSFARVVAPDDAQAAAGVKLAKVLGVRKVYVLHGATSYGQGLAGVFTAKARRSGVTVVGDAEWDPTAPDYTELFREIKAAHPDGVYLAGFSVDNGVQLIRDKVAVLGDNSTVKLLAPEGFASDPAIDQLPQAQGMYLGKTGVTADQIRTRGGAGARLLDDYRARYGSDPQSPYAVYAVAALQVIIQAVKNSDGTRSGIQRAIFSNPGVRVPAGTSVLGRTIKIDPGTGDVNLREFTVVVIQANTESFFKTITLRGPVPSPSDIDPSRARGGRGM